MKVTVFSTKRYDQQYLNAGNARSSHEFLFLEDRLHRATAPLAAGAEAVCAFVNDVLDAPTLEILARGGTRLIVLRCAGFNQVIDIDRNLLLTLRAKNALQSRAQR